MKKEPLVSIGIPTYNRHASLKKTIESLISQTYKNIEIIISDNCSLGDETDKVVNSFLLKDKRIKYFKQDINKGATHNFQFVLNNSSGDYFMWLADDDWLDRNYIQECMEVSKTTDNVSIVCGNTRIYDENLNFIFSGEQLQLLSNNKYRRIMRFYKEVAICSLYYGLLPMQYAREINCRHQFADDWLISAQMLFLGKSIVIENVNSHRSQGVSRSIDSLSKFYGIKKLNKKTFPFYIAKNASMDIIKNDFYKNRISMIKRILFATLIFNLIIARYVFRYIEKILNHLSKK